MAYIIKVYGPPGTGKTEKLRGLVVERKTPLPRVGYLSFTRGAADVIRDRMGASTEDVRWFRTIHSACMALLGIGRESVVAGGDYKRFREITGMEVRTDEYDDWGDDKPVDFTPTKRALELSAATCTDIYEVIKKMPPHVNLTRARVDLFIDKWTAFKRENHKFDFTDMLTQYLLKPTPMPCDDIYLDEAQDLSVLQWKVFHELIKDAKNVYMAGDDDQAIYPFIGGSEYGFLDHACDEEQILTHSHRCPKSIGEAADRIIRKVGHRKIKPVTWKEIPGDVSMMNLDAFTLPWRVWIERYKSIMVLCRHRKGARDFSDDLKAVGIPHELNGEGLASWKEAKIVETYLTLKDDGKVTAKAARKLLDELGMSIEIIKTLKPRAHVTRALLPCVDFDAPTWVGMLAGDSRVKLRRYEAIRQLVNNDGLASLAKKPVVRIKTMHAAKGDEAELVIIVPECTSIVKRNMLTPGEIRLAYVAMTRAERQVVVLIPRTDCYITHFFGG